MRFRVITLLVVCLVCVISSQAQNKKIQVFEDSFKAEIDANRIVLSFDLENSSSSPQFETAIKFEILDVWDEIRAKSETKQNLKNGKQHLEIPIDLKNSSISEENLLWYRLRYEFTSNAEKIGGIVSFSQILPDIFELRAIGSDGVLENKIHRIRLRASNPANDEAVKGVEITGEISIEDSETKIKAKAVTDREGLATLEFQMPEFDQGEYLELEISGKKGGIIRTIEEDLNNFSNRQVFLNTDKTIYQPDQTVNFRLFYTDFQKTPLKNRELTIEMEQEDGDEEIVFTEKVKTSKFGIASTSWKISASVPLGNYQIYVRSGDDDDGKFGVGRIKITRYDLPNFYVYTQTDKAFYLPEQTKAKVEINAEYLFGKSLNSGNVRIFSKSEDFEMPEIKGEIDKDGKFTAEIDLTKAHEEFESSNWRKFEDLTFNAVVTDTTTGRSEQRNFDIRITDESIHVYFIGNEYDQSIRQPLKFYVSAFYADGRPATECDVKIYERFENEDEKLPDEIGGVIAQVKTNSYGVAKVFLILQKNEDEEIDIKLIATDKEKNAGTQDQEISYKDKSAIRVETNKIAYKQGESVKVSINSSEQNGTVYVDIVKDFEILATQRTQFRNGKAEISFPFIKEFENDLKVVAYIEDKEDDDEILSDIRGIIFPKPDFLNIKTSNEKALYRPGEEAKINFTSLLGNKTPTETAFGVLVLDKAILERARSLSESNYENSFLKYDFLSPFQSLFGEEKIFGRITNNEIKNLDLSKPLDPDLELALEVGLRESYHRISILQSRDLRNDFEINFARSLEQKVSPVQKALRQNFTEKGTFPTDEKSLNEILANGNVDLSNIKDAWGNTFQTNFRTERDKLILEISTLGADKKSGTFDDLIVLKDSWNYFVLTGKPIADVLLEYTSRTNDFIKDFKTLRMEVLQRKNFDLENLRDAWGNPYKFEFSVERSEYVLKIKSGGENGKFETTDEKKSDDFTIWTHRTDYFVAQKANLNKAFLEYVAQNKTFPNNENAMSEILKKIGFDLENLKDAFGRNYYIEQRFSRESAGYYQNEDKKYRIKKQKIAFFDIKSSGEDGIRKTPDDFTLTVFQGAVVEESDEESKTDYDEIPTERTIIRQSAVASPNGAIGGTIADYNGAVIPGAMVEIYNNSSSIVRTVSTNENGYFVIDNLPEDTYSMRISSSGFSTLVFSNLIVQRSILLEVFMILEVADVSVTVNVSSGAETIDSTSSAIQTTVTTSKVVPTIREQPTFTPHVRSYFAETLFWSPELVSDKKGNAEIKFKLADSLTTWKLYAIGTTEEGKIGYVEKEFQTFKPFFAELDPPKILTEGDEISLPVPIRNYTKQKQKVAVEMEKNTWSELLQGSTNQVEVDADSTKNAIFNFRALSPIKNGKQKVSAIAKNEGDAIEKEITVKPNGKEINQTQAKFGGQETIFDLDFPSESFPKTRKAEINIYPNMFSHVAESIEGLLKRPYGCGEQTTSSTYPNLMILKIAEESKDGINPELKNKAEQYLQDGYKRLLTYQTDSGFGYWNGGSPDLALTAYVLQFLSDAEDFIEVDESSVEKAENYLFKQQNADGSFNGNYSKSKDLMTAYIAHILAQSGSNKTAVQKAVEYLKTRLPEINDGYILANFALAAVEINDLDTANSVLEKLTANGEIPFKAERTAFYGWGKTAEIETTAIALQALIRFKIQDSRFKNEDLISKGLLYLLKNKDKYGVWDSTQTTVNVLNTLILFQENLATENNSSKAEIFLNGVKIKDLDIEKRGLTNPLTFEITENLNESNKLEIRGLDNLTLASTVSNFYVDWQSVQPDFRYFDFNVEYDKTNAKIGEEIICRVKINSKTKNYGMLLAEIGLPPSADVDRISLDKAVREDAISRYDILPDKVVIYAWADEKPKNFSFAFKSRYGINAQNSASKVYDYYNEEAQAEISPVRFNVK